MIRNNSIYPSVNSTSQRSTNNTFTKKYKNVMESLVLEEVEVQIQSLPQKTARHIKPSEVTAYALNRLPGLYATGKRGWQKQWHRGKTELHPKITAAVRQGIIAVQRDPLRSDIPINSDDEQTAQETEALKKMKVLLQRDDISWNNVVHIMEQTLLDTLRGNVTWSKRGRSDDEIFNWEEYPQYQSS